MSEGHPLDVAAWLTELTSSPEVSPISQDQDTPTSTKTPHKRKRQCHEHSDHPQEHSHPREPLTYTALTQLSLNIMNTPSPSVEKRAAKRIKVIKRTLTPQTDLSKHSYEAASRPPTTTPGDSSGSKQTLNELNVRFASVEQGMAFEDEESYEKYSDFKEHIEKMVFGNRGSAMRIESLRSIKTWRVEYALQDEKTYFTGLVPKIFKETRGDPASKERSFGEEIELQAKAFKDDGLGRREDCLFTKNLLPLRTPYALAAARGVTTAKPDFVYGLRRPHRPDLDAPVLSDETQAEIGVAPGLRHAFFSVDNKGGQHSIEAAENQAMRAGATMVRARRFLNRKAKGKIGSAPNAEATMTAPVQQANETQEEDLGVDTSSFAFTCSWVPQMANLHVHWCERYPGGKEMYHMNLLRGYLMSDNSHVSSFRKDVHNILDWGVSPERKEILKQLERDIAQYEMLGGTGAVRVNPY